MFLKLFNLKSSVALILATIINLSALAQANGNNVTYVEYAGGGYFAQVTGKKWNETGKFDFIETNRDEWSVYLLDQTRDITIQLDLHGKVVVINWDRPNRAKIYTITKAVAGPQMPIQGAYYHISARHSDKVLDVYGNSMADGGRVVQHDFHGGANQQFKFVPAEGGTFNIISKSSGKALDVSGAKTNDGAQIFQWTYHKGANQRFRLVPLDGQHFMVVTHCGKAWDITGGPNEKANGVNLQQWSFGGGTNQQFKIKMAK